MIPIKFEMPTESKKGSCIDTTKAYIANNHEYLKKYGASITYQGDNLKIASTKYTTEYPNNDTEETNNSTTSQKNLQTIPKSMEMQ